MTAAICHSSLVAVAVAVVIVVSTVVVAVMAVVAVVVYMERAQRRITVNYAKRQQGRRVYAAQQSHLPLKINNLWQ